MPKLDLDAIEQTDLTGYPPPFDADVEGRWYRRLAPVAGFAKMGASHVTLKPGAYSSQRHWHEGQDELVVMLEGEAVLVEDEGETVVCSGDVLTFPAGARNGHRLHNRGEVPCVFVEISAGDKAQDHGGYSDIDMVFGPEGYAKRDGTPYATKRAP